MQKYKLEKIVHKTQPKVKYQLEETDKIHNLNVKYSIEERVQKSQPERKVLASGNDTKNLNPNAKILAKGNCTKHTTESKVLARGN